MNVKVRRVSSLSWFATLAFRAGFYETRLSAVVANQQETSIAYFHAISWNRWCTLLKETISVLGAQAKKRLAQPGGEALFQMFTRGG